VIYSKLSPGKTWRQIVLQCADDKKAGRRETHALSFSCCSLLRRQTKKVIWKKKKKRVTKK